MSEPRVLVEHDVEARMRDGVVLRANVYAPTEGGPFPVLLSRQPYGKDVNINPTYADPERLAAAGYLVVMQDVRGRYASDGEFTAGDQEFEDGYDTVQWAAGLPRSDGRVGLWGRSYHAETQWRAAALRPPALRSMASGVSKFHHDLEGEERPGGAHEGSRLGWRQVQIGPEAVRRRFAGDTVGLAAARADHADFTAGLTSGAAFDVLPLRSLQGRPGSELDPVLAAMSGPADAALGRPWPADHYELGEVEVFHLGGWYDIFLAGTLEQYGATLQTAHPGRPPRLLIGPWTHTCFLRTQGELDFGADADGSDLGGSGGLNAEHLRWFDATLKGDRAALETTAPVRLFVMGENRWRDYDRYPIPGTVVQDWYLQPDGGLAPTPAPPSDPDRFRYDPADPVPVLGGSTLLSPELPPGPYDQRPIERRADVLSFTSATLSEPLTVIGAVRATLAVSTSAADTDVVARLVDVHPDGRAIGIVDGIIRLSCRDRYPRPGDFVPGPLGPVEPQTIYEVCVDLQATGLTFLVGHRIRLDVTSSCHPRWLRHPNTARDQVDADELVVADQFVHHGPAHPSRLHLSVVPAVTAVS